MRLIDADAKIKEIEIVIANLKEELREVLVDRELEPRNSYHNWSDEIATLRSNIRTRKAMVRILKEAPTACYTDKIADLVNSTVELYLEAIVSGGEE